MALCILLSPDLAQAVTVATMGREHQLRPVKIAAGDLAGSYVLPLGVLHDPAHADQRAALSVCPIEDIDPATAWPETNEAA
ncbi:hypothetical protein [Sphingomonas colocasiae]|uniref:Uncharacterized protein n=1 Tax=Sphingomonas colocasiae TaxID=1848973 RepID=A0ABS7PXM9_9SPHN|nr:hypothetical protein [Sphingomonas colocasiae]MBY8826120.1 hypothetical protein [Sphingomonas colocasiae]